MNTGICLLLPVSPNWAPLDLSWAALDSRATSAGREFNLPQGPEPDFKKVGVRLRMPLPSQAGRPVGARFNFEDDSETPLAAFDQRAVGIREDSPAGESASGFQSQLLEVATRALFSSQTQAAESAVRSKVLNRLWPGPAAADDGR